MSDIKKEVVQTARGRHGWRFIFREYGRTLSLRDYTDVKVRRVSRSVKDFEKQKEKVLVAALIELHGGRFIYGEMLVRLCKRHGVKISKNVLFQLKYMNELDVSINVLRHKNTRGDFARHSFNGVFSVIEYLIAKTL